MKSIKLIATDYDDTLVTYSGTMVLMDGFANILSYLSGRENTKWVIVTGRRYFSLSKVLCQFARRKMVPDFLIVSEGFIFRKMWFGYFPLLSWNLKMWFIQRKLISNLRKLVESLKHNIESKWPDSAQNKSLATGHLWYEFNNDMHLQEAIEFLQGEIAQSPGLVVFSNDNEVYLGISYCLKGPALQKLSETLSLSKEDVFVVGDGVNDMSMLDGKAAKMNACVGNACKQVKACVSESGGYVASNENVLGVIESLNYYIGQCKQ